MEPNTPNPNPNPGSDNQNNRQPHPNRPQRPPRFRKPGAGTTDPNRSASTGVPAPQMGPANPDRGEGQRQGGGGNKRQGGGGGGRRRRNGQSTVNHTDLLPPVDAVPVNKSAYNGDSGKQQLKPKGLIDRAGGNQIDSSPKLRVIPLGGLGEVGKNMMAVEYGDDIVIIDMGFLFPKAEQPGVDYIIPDTSWLEKNRHRVKGIVITHGHEDHIGATPFILPKFPVPIYGSRFTLARIENKLVEYKLQTQPQYRVLDPDKHERVQIGQFNVELVRVTHSIPDACAVVLRTPAGTIIHTGDWRFDPTPVDQRNMDMERFKAIGDEGVLMLMSDSTGCEKPGRTPSEMEIAAGFDTIFSKADGRIIISSFSTQINRMQLVVDAAGRAGRKLAFVGRSMLSNVELAIKMGYIKVPQGMIMRVQEIVNLPENQIVVLCTGSQGEENSALSRMGTGEHQNIKIKAGDTIVFSASPIPGNDLSIVRSVDNLMREGAKVFQHITRDIDGHGMIHVSGHASRDEILEFMEIVRPKYFMPIHGEFHHLVRNAELVVTEGSFPRDNVFVCDNGDVIELSANGTARRAGRVPAGMVMIDGAGIGDVEGIVLRDRLAMAGDGVFMIIATVSRKTGKLISSPDIISRGFIYMKENEELINKARTEVRRAFEKHAVAGGPTSREEWAKFKLQLRDEIGDVLYAKTKRSPMILPVINEV